MDSGGGCAQYNKLHQCISYNPTYTVSPLKRTCTYPECTGSSYYKRNKLYTETTGGCGGAAPQCPVMPSSDSTYSGASFAHTYLGGGGGSAPNRAIACTRVNGPVDVSLNCNSMSCPGASGANASFSGGIFGTASGLQSGKMGRSCYPKAGNKVAYSIGGGGGTPCVQGSIKFESGFFGDAYSDAVSVANDKLGGYGLHIGVNADGSTTITVNTNAESVSGLDSSFMDAFDSFANISFPTSTNDIFSDWLCETVGSGGPIVKACGKPGSAGKSVDNCDNTTGINTNAQGRYNHIYAWTMPYSVNRLTYGEAGEAGEYKSTKISQVVAALKVKLGKGGVWANNDWETGKQGPDGTDTVVSMGDKTVLVAKGGKGGKQNQYTNRYDLCYAKAGVCKLGDKSTNCCESEKGTRSTKDILITAGKMSAFENIKALVGNSLIIGTGLGRGGDGAGTRAGVEENYDKRYFLNASGYGVNYPTSSVFQPPENEFASGSANANDYINKALTPSEMNFKGGDGAVIITW